MVNVTKLAETFYTMGEFLQRCMPYLEKCCLACSSYKLYQSNMDFIHCKAKF